MSDFDPNAAARPDAGIFGLATAEDDAALVLVPVPFDATASYRPGARKGPAAILTASHQVELFDLQTGKPYERGIHLQAAEADIERLSAAARAAAEPVLAQGGAGPGDAAAVAVIDGAGARVNELVRGRVEALLARGKLVGVVGGDHSVPFGAIAAAAARHEGLGILHVDAHADLRRAYEGFEWSHASIMDNVVRKLAAVGRIVQIGIRDLCGEEMDAIGASEGRVVTWFDLDWRRRLGAGEKLATLCDEVVRSLPEAVWVSLDIDGLDPALCPHTGTPVPGGLSFAELCVLLEALARSGRRIVGFDLCEVAPGPDGDEWDANVGARVLYKLCGFTLLTG